MRLLSLLPNLLLNLLLDLLPAPALARLRKGLLRYGKSQSPAALLARSQQGAYTVATQAAHHSAAYQTLLQEHGLNPHALDTTHWAALPVLTKSNTFGRFTLAQLSRPHAPRDLADVLTSSGRSGHSFGFKLTTHTEQTWFDTDLGLQDSFKVDELDTLLINCLPMGVVFPSRAVTVANVSVREDMACALLRDIGPRFQQTLLCTDPLFIRRLLAEGQRVGLDWGALNTSVIMGEEVLVEAQRDYLAARMGINLDPAQNAHRLIGSSYGVGELGLNLLFETRETIPLRRALRTQPQVAHLLLKATPTHTPPCVFCFNPLRCWVEVVNPDASGFGELCITLLNAQAVIALPRYATGDWGRMVSHDEASQAAQLAQVPCPWLPLVVLKGRIKDRPLGQPSVEDIKTLIYTDFDLADQLSGAFRLTRTKLTLQAASDPAAQNPNLHTRLHQRMGQLLGVTVPLEILAPTDFPHRPLLDFERKFNYLG